MTAITSTDQLVAALRPPVAFLKTTSSITAGFWASLWLATGSPGAGAAPGAAVLCSGATPGALPVPALAAGQDLFLAAAKATATVGLSMQVIDRLAHSSGLSGTVTTAQAVNTPALDGRYPDSVGNMIALEVYTALGATTTTATVSYTNQAGVAGRTATVTIPASAPASRFLQVPFAAGDTGAQGVQSVTLAASTGTAGNFGVTLYRSLAQVGVPVAGLTGGEDFAQLGLPDIGAATSSSACLSLLLMPVSTATVTLTGAVTLAVN